MTPFRPGGPKRYRHQVAGLRKLIETKGICALLFDPGTGKTATTLDYAGLLALKSPTREARVLVVAPLAAVDTWVDQAQKFVTPDVAVRAEVLTGSIKRRANLLAARGGRPFTGPATKDLPKLRRGQRPEEVGEHLSPALWVRSKGQAKLTLMVVNLDSFKSRAPVKVRTRSGQLRDTSATNADLMVEAVKRYGPHLVVVDESHRIKSIGSNSSRALARLTKHVPRRVLLTGTLMPHSPLDVFGQWRFMEPYALGWTDRHGVRRKATYEGFRDRFTDVNPFTKELKGFKDLDQLERILAKNSIVAKKEDALDLPPTTDVIVPVELSPRERKAYADMKRDLATRFADGSLTAASNRLVQGMRLRQITSGFLHDNDQDVTEELGQSKSRTIASIVNDTLAGEKRVVVFCHFRREIDQVARLIAADKDTDVVTVTGQTSQEDRTLIRKRFGSSDPQRIVLVAQTRTMSLAVNELVTASHAVYGSLSQQRDDMVQSRDRLNRIGQTRPVTFWLALAPGTVDHVIYQSHQDRTDLETALLRHIAAG